MIESLSLIAALVALFLTVQQNNKNSARTLINQEIKATRCQLQELIVICSSEKMKFPIPLQSEAAVKLYSYLGAVKELNYLYVSYESPCFLTIRIVNTVRNQAVSLVNKSEILMRLQNYVVHWLLPEKCLSSSNKSSTFNVSEHVKNVRQLLTDDGEKNATNRLSELNLEYRKLCSKYLFVN